MGESKNFENQESIIDGLIINLEKKEWMNPGDIQSDIITFASYDGNEEFFNPEYFEVLAEKLGISIEEVNIYVAEKVKDYLAE